jgi:glycosyltransferase involved in cell wall biosynthesis
MEREHLNGDSEITESEQTRGVGFVASGGSGDSLAGAILRANRRNYEVFVINDGGSESAESVQFAEMLGATLIHLGASQTSRDAVRQRLGVEARKHGCSSVLVHFDTTKYIDYDRSESRIEGEIFLTEATTVEENADTAATLDVLVAIPAFNESGTIASVVEQTLPVVDAVLVVDDGSTDETVVRAEEAGATVVVHDRNRGYGGAIQAAFREARARGAQHLVLIDADGQHNPSDIPKLVRAQQEYGTELVIGSRFVDGGTTDAPAYRRVGLSIVNVMTNLSLGTVFSKSYIQDTQSGFRAFNRTAIESLASSNKISNGMSASTDILYHAHASGFDIKEVGTEITYDVESASSHRPIEHGMALVENILQTVERQRPMTVLGVPGFLSALIGLGLAYWAISNFVSTGALSVGATVMSSVLILGGIFTCFTGIILHALNTQVVHHLE